MKGIISDPAGSVGIFPVEALLAELQDALSLGGRVGERGEHRGHGQRVLVHALDGEELPRLPVAERDRAGLVEEQRVDVAGQFDGLAALRKQVVRERPVHAGDADGGQERADGRRDEADEERHERRHVDGDTKVAADGEERGRHHEEGEGEAGEHDGEGDLVRRLLPLGPLDEGNHAVEERVARLGGDADFYFVGEHARAAGDARAVAARLADDRGALARDGALVDGGDALDDLAVGRDRLALGHNNDVAGPEDVRGDVFYRAVVFLTSGRGGLARLPERVRLRLSARLGKGLGEVGEEDGEPEDDREK